MASEAAAADDAATTGGPPECTEMEEQVCNVCKPAKLDTWGHYLVRYFMEDLTMQYG